MKAKLINEKFTEKSDPVKDMNIGDPEKSLFPILKKELKKYGIYIDWHKDWNMGEGFWYFTVEFNLDNSDQRVDSEIEVQMSYATDEAIEASEEDWSSGFGLTDADGSEELLDYTHDINQVVKTLVKRKFGSKKEVLQYAKLLQKQLQKIQDILKVL